MTNAISVAKVTSVTNATSDKIVISVTNRTIVVKMTGCLADLENLENGPLLKNQGKSAKV